jgi:hypothetical protein
MTTEHLGPLSFETPPAWENRNILVLVAPRETRSAPAPNIVVMKEPRAPDTTLVVHAWSRFLEISKTLDDVSLLSVSETRVGGRAAVQLHFRWKDAHGDAEQAIVYVDTPDGTLTVTCTAPASLDRPWMPILERVLASGRFAIG